MKEIIILVLALAVISCKKTTTITEYPSWRVTYTSGTSVVTTLKKGTTVKSSLGFQENSDEEFIDVLSISYSHIDDLTEPADTMVHNFILEHSRFPIDPKSGARGELVFSKTYIPLKMKGSKQEIDLDGVKCLIEMIPDE